MSEREPVALDEKQALTALDVHFGMLLRCAASDLRRPGWTLVAAPADADPMGLLFGQRPLVTVLAPRADQGADQDADEAAAGGVALIAPELRAPVAAVLRAWPPAQLFTPEGRAALDAAIRDAFPRAVTPAAEAHTHLRYAVRAGFRPYLGRWLDWIEALDEGAEMDLRALGLLARYGGGVYVVRDRGAILSFAGIRPQSPAIWELRAGTATEALRGHGLARAVASRATRAIFEAGRLPLYAHAAHDDASARAATALGYRLYAEAAIYLAPLA